MHTVPVLGTSQKPRPRPLRGATSYLNLGGQRVAGELKPDLVVALKHRTGVVRNHSWGVGTGRGGGVCCASTAWAAHCRRLDGPPERAPKPVVKMEMAFLKKRQLLPHRQSGLEQSRAGVQDRVPSAWHVW